MKYLIIYALLLLSFGCSNIAFAQDSSSDQQPFSVTQPMDLNPKNWEQNAIQYGQDRIDLQNLQLKQIRKQVALENAQRRQLVNNQRKKNLEAAMKRCAKLPANADYNTRSECQAINDSLRFGTRLPPQYQPVTE